MQIPIMRRSFPFGSFISEFIHGFHFNNVEELLRIYVSASLTFRFIGISQICFVAEVNKCVHRIAEVNRIAARVEQKKFIEHAMKIVRCERAILIDSG